MSKVKGETKRGSICPLKSNGKETPKSNGKAKDSVKPTVQKPSQKTNGKLTPSVEPRQPLASLCIELQALQRQRVVYMKSRIMMSNRLQAIVAGTIGYSSGMEEKAKAKVLKEAKDLIKRIDVGEEGSPLVGIVRGHMVGINALRQAQKEIETEMDGLAKQLPVADWVRHEDQRGFGLLFLAIVIGETGDLSNYANPGKVWRRLGCAPHTYDGQTFMGGTWRGGKHGKLPAAEWEEFGYSPRRRSISYLIGEGAVKQNGVGPYRKRYDETKVIFKQKHPDYSPLRCHRHGMLLATKLLLKNLWIEWNK